MGHPTNAPKFYGSATVGPKGQIVIPAEARTSLNLKSGDKVLIMGVGAEGKMLGVCPASQVETMLTHLTNHLEALRQAVNAEGEQSSPKTK